MQHCVVIVADILVFWKPVHHEHDLPALWWSEVVHYYGAVGALSGLRPLLWMMCGHFD
jgi:hypothetical protein